MSTDDAYEFVTLNATRLSWDEIADELEHHYGISDDGRKWLHTRWSDLQNGTVLSQNGTLDDVAPGAEPDLINFQHTDVGNAHRFVAMHAGRFRHVRQENRWLEWRGGRYRRDVTGAAERAATEVVETLLAQAFRLSGDERKAAIGWALRSQSSNAIRAMLTIAASDAEIVVSSDQLDADLYRLSCGNGTLDLRSGELRVALSRRTCKRR